ncbi:MAG: hypothetical protein ACRDV9_08760 [Acidimicrobiia bacterium]
MGLGGRHRYRSLGAIGARQRGYRRDGGEQLALLGRPLYGGLPGRRDGRDDLDVDALGDLRLLFGGHGFRIPGQGFRAEAGIRGWDQR